MEKKGGEAVERYRSLNRYLRETYGEKLYKLALDGGFTCPNRDGTLGTGGCSFCSGRGSGDFAESCRDGVPAAVRRAEGRVAHKNPGGRYIAYFQSFSSTYAPAERLRALFAEAVSLPEVAVLSVATRPDCLPEETVKLLEELNRVKPVWVELGLQTVHPETARRIRRGYELPVYDGAVRRLKEAEIPVITHVILGLPGESPEMIWETVRHVGEVGSWGVKLQLLHVLEGTDLAKEYRAGAFEALTLEEYLPLLAGCVERLPRETVIHRLTGDGAKRELIAPAWSGDKKRVLNAIARYFDEHDVRQGAKWQAEAKT